MPLERRAPRRLGVLELVGNTPLVELSAALAEPGRQDLREARGPEPDRLDQGPRREGDDRDGRGARRARARPRAARADERQHRHLARDGREAQGLPAHLRHARERDAGAHAAARAVRREDRLLAGRGGLERRGAARARDGRARAALLHAVPVRERGEPARPLRGHGRRDRRGAPARRRLRRRPRHRRHAHGLRRAAARVVPGRPDRRAPSRSRATSVMGLRSLEDGYMPPILDVAKLDRKMLVSNQEAVAGVRLLLEREGIFAGVSSGAAVHVAPQIAERAGRGRRRHACSPTAAGSTSPPTSGRSRSRTSSGRWKTASGGDPGRACARRSSSTPRRSSRTRPAASSRSATASPSATSRRATRAASPYRFELDVDPETWFLEDEGYELAVFHSHLSSPPRPVAHRRREHRPLGGAALRDPHGLDRRARRLAHPRREGRLRAPLLTLVPSRPELRRPSGGQTADGETTAELQPRVVRAAPVGRARGLCDAAAGDPDLGAAPCTGRPARRACRATIQEALASCPEGPVTVTGLRRGTEDQRQAVLGAAESYPPQCGQPALTVEGLDLDGVEGAHAARPIRSSPTRRGRSGDRSPAAYEADVLAVTPSASSAQPRHATRPEAPQPSASGRWPVTSLEGLRRRGHDAAAPHRAAERPARPAATRLEAAEGRGHHHRPGEPARTARSRADAARTPRPAMALRAALRGLR